MAPFPSPCQKPEGFTVKLHNCAVTIAGSPPGFELSGLSTLHLQQFVNYSLGLLTPVLVSTDSSASVSCDPLYLPDCLSNSGARVCLVTPLL